MPRPITANANVLVRDDTAYNTSPRHRNPKNIMRLSLAPILSMSIPKNAGRIILGIESADDNMEYCSLEMWYTQ